MFIWCFICITYVVLFVLEIFNFWTFRTLLNFMTSWKAWPWSKKYVLLNSLGSKHSLIITFGQFISCYKRKTFTKKFYKKYGLEISSRPFRVIKNQTQPLVENEVFETSWSYWIHSFFYNPSFYKCKYAEIVIIWKHKIRLAILEAGENVNKSGDKQKIQIRLNIFFKTRT